RNMRIVLLLLSAPATLLGQLSCEQLKSIDLPAATVTLAASAPAGPFRLPGAAETSPAMTLPAHCRVALTLKPSADSDIKAEVWLPPQKDWNGKLLMEGGGGFVGFLSYGAMATALREGYATTSTDTGHTGGNASFALGHPEKVVDF